MDAFKIPQIYQKIIERYHDTILPDSEMLKAIFYSHGIATNALDTAVNVFIASAKFAGAIDQNNRLLPSNIGNEPLPSGQMQPLGEDQGLEQQQNPVQVPPNITNATLGASGKPEIDVFKFEIPTTLGKKASILLPKDWVKEDIDLLIKLLRVFSPEDKT
jgi:hypothetical protein